MSFNNFNNTDPTNLDFNSFLRLASGFMNNASMMIPENAGNMLQSPQFINTVENVTQQILNNLLNAETNQSHQQQQVQQQVQQQHNYRTEQQLQQQKTKDLFFDLPVTLEELYKGKTKKINVKRKHTYEQSDGSFKLVEEKNSLSVHISSGMKNNHHIVFHNEADQIPGFDIGDVIIVLKEQPHASYLRCGDDLFLNSNISISELYYFDASIQLLNGEFLRLQNQQGDLLTEYNSIRKVSGYGMPIEGTQLYGDLFIQFNIVPRTETFPSITDVRAIFPPLNELKDDTAEAFVLLPLDDKDYCKLDMFEDDEDFEHEQYEDDEEDNDDEDDDDEEDDEEDEEDDDEEEEDIVNNYFSIPETIQEGSVILEEGEEGDNCTDL